jgi:hypothetical protein
MATYSEAIAAGVATTSGVIFPVDTTTQGADTLAFPISKLAYGTTGVVNLVSSTLPFPVASASSGLIQISGPVTAVVSSSGGLSTLAVVSASSGLVQISGVPSVVISSSAGLSTITVVSASSGLVQISGTPTVTSTAATNPWSSAPSFNLPVVSVSSGLVQISGTPTVTSTAATNPWSSAPGFNMPVLSVSSGLVQISGTATIVSASSGLVQISGTPTIVSASSGLVQISGTATVVSASSGVIQLTPLSTAGTLNGLNVQRFLSTGGAASQNVASVPSNVFGWAAYNSTAGALAIKIYNTSSGAPTVGTTAGLFHTILVPGSTAGAGNNMAAFPYGLYCNKGLGFTMTANMNDTDTGVAGNNSLALNLYYV